MNKIILLFAGFFFIHNISFGQNSNDKIMFVVDSIPVIDDPEEGNEILQTDIADITVIKNKDTLNRLGYGRFDGVTFIFTKEYRNRPDSLKQIPSSKQMERKNGVFLFHGMPYSGRFIDYYYSGRKQGDGVFLNGKVNGHRTMYYQNGKVSVEREYKDGIENGFEIEYYEDGSLQQKGEFVNGKENGIWDMYFPNGQLKQRSNFVNGVMDGETTVYYSTGKILAVEITKNGKTTPDKRLEKIYQAMSKGHASNKEEDYKSAIKNYSKAIELDSTYAEAYFSRGTVKLNNFQFDEAIADFDKALQFEPFMSYALSNRAFARIRKYQFANSRTISKNSEVTVLASKDKVPIPYDEQEKICNDLRKAVFLGDKSKMITKALSEYCQTKSSR
ncbi:MAG: tetratricopeptide repeat protein [Sediminibacterium sp.]|jgi:tetratricopeptide (TPR) repeat protein|nr:tetratricopeptide repeat protein [Chitinophagaceae bacterium]MCA6446601.1 tetratricopeptide repeat protein [Chitinophagaceae bacterium]